MYGLFSWDLFPVATVKLLCIPAHNNVPGKLHFFSAIVVALYTILVLVEGNEF